MNAVQLANGVPGSFPLPNPGQPGSAYVANKMHPAAMAAAQRSLPPRQNPMNGGRGAAPAGGAPGGAGK